MANGDPELFRECAEAASKVRVGKAEDVVSFQILKHPVVEVLFVVGSVGFECLEIKILCVENGN